MDYTTVFDVSQSGFRQWWFPASGLIFIAVGLALPALIRAGVFRKVPPAMEKWFPRVILGFAIFWTLTSFVGTFGGYWSAVQIMRSDRAEVVEGVVTEFKPMPHSGHAMESFVVNGVRFEYSDFVITAGFNNTASHGGPIREGLPVKIWHSDGRILRLDVKKPNQAMQLTASKPAIYAVRACRRERMLRRMHSGLAAADLVSR